MNKLIAPDFSIERIPHNSVPLEDIHKLTVVHLIALYNLIIKIFYCLIKNFIWRKKKLKKDNILTYHSHRLYSITHPKANFYLGYIL